MSVIDHGVSIIAEPMRDGHAGKGAPLSGPWRWRFIVVSAGGTQSFSRRSDAEAHASQLIVRRQPS